MVEVLICSLFLNGKGACRLEDIPKTSVGKFDKIAVRKKIDEFMAKAKRVRQA